MRVPCFVAPPPSQTACGDDGPLVVRAGTPSPLGTAKMKTIIWTTAPLIIAAVETLAATIRHRRQPRAVIGHCRKMVEHAEARCTQQDPERTQEVFRLAIKKLHPVRSAIAKPGGGKSGSDRIIAFLMRPETARLPVRTGPRVRIGRQEQREPHRDSIGNQHGPRRRRLLPAAD